MIKFSTTSADGTKLFGRHWPVESPTSVMALVHGFGEHSGRYDHMAQHLNANSIAVVALDLHGHGKTEGPRGVVNSEADFQVDLAALLAKARESYPDISLVIYGHSMGGGIVMNYGVEAPDSVPIISSAPFIRPADPIPKPLEFFVRLMARLRPKGAITQPIDGSKISNLPKEQSAYLEDPLCHGTLGFRLAKAMVETGENIAAKAQNWDRPLLLLHSKADQLTRFETSEEFAQSAKQVEFYPFHTVQHEMHNDTTRDEVYALMTDFILRHAEPATS